MSKQQYGQVVGFRVEGPLLRKLERDRKRQGVSRSDVIRRIILQHYEQPLSQESIGLLA